MLAPIAWTLRQSAQDHTHLYFALLPSDLRQFIDRHFDWHIDGADPRLRRVELGVSVASAEQVVSPDGEAVVVVSEYVSRGPRRTCLVAPIA